MNKSSINFNRQTLRLCKGIIKAWEKWLDEVEYENIDKNHDGESQVLRKDKREDHQQLSHTKMYL